MARKNTPEVKTEQKVQTKYDRKMEARRQQKLKDERQAKLAKIIAAAIGIVIVGAAIGSAAVSIISRNTALRGTYVKVGDHELTQLEYDYFYKTSVSNYLNAYSSILPYMGLDTTKDFADQQYTDELTWKDMFDEMTVEQIRQNKAMVDDARKAGFTYDMADDYENFSAELEDAAKSAGVSLGEYYKESFGEYATKKNVEGFVKDSLLANAYYNDLLEKNKPSDEEVGTYYEDNRQTYDKADYRSFMFTAQLSEDASEDEINKAMDEAGAKAEAMKKARQEGGDFEKLCLENASEDEKENYENADSEYSLNEGKYFSGVPSVIADWLFEDGRKEGDITVLRDDDYHRFYVVEFVGRYYDEADNEKISNTLASQRVSDYMAGLLENYQVSDVKGHLKYLTVDTSEGTGEDAAEDTAEEGAEEGDAAGSAADGDSAGTETE